MEFAGETTATPQHSPQSLAHCARPCRDYCCSAFLQYRDEHAGLWTLEGSIHLLFRQRTFSNDVHYGDLEQSLKLASNLINRLDILEYIDTVSYGDIRDFHGNKIDIWQIDDATFRTSLSATWPKAGENHAKKKSRQRARRVLRQLADMVEFGVLEHDPSNVQRPSEVDASPSLVH